MKHKIQMCCSTMRARCSRGIRSDKYYLMEHSSRIRSSSPTGKCSLRRCSVSARESKKQYARTSLVRHNSRPLLGIPARLLLNQDLIPVTCRRPAGRTSSVGGLSHRNDVRAGSPPPNAIDPKENPPEALCTTVTIINKKAAANNTREIARRLIRCHIAIPAWTMMH